MNENIVAHIQRLRGRMSSNKEVADVLVDLLLENDLQYNLREMSWSTVPEHKITIMLEIYP